MLKIIKVFCVSIVILFCIVSCEKTTEPKPENQIQVTLRNDTDVVIVSAHVRMPGFTIWSKNILSKTLDRGKSSMIYIPIDFLDLQNQIDIQIRDAEGFAYTRYRIEIVEKRMITFVENHFDTNMIRRFDINNNTDTDIVSAHIRMPGDTRWGNNLMTDDRFPQDTTITVIIPTLKMDDLFRLDIQLRTSLGINYLKLAEPITNFGRVVFLYEDLDSDTGNIISLINNTGVVITECFIKRPQTSNWNNLKLEKQLNIGEAQTLTIPKSFMDNQNRVDIQLRTANDVRYNKMSQAVFHHEAVIFNHSDIDTESIRTIILVNNTGNTISYGYVRTPATASWGNPIYQSTLQDGESVSLIIPKSILNSQNMVDVQLRTFSGERYSRLAQTITNNNVITFVSTDFAYEIGSPGPAGGFIFYDKGSFSDGWRYLEAAPSDEASASWGANATDITGTSLTIGSGLANTELIVSRLQSLGETNRAAQLCANKTLNGFSDWFLPSKDELNQMYINLYLNGLGGLQNSWYWSSSQSGSNIAWNQDFSTGHQNDREFKAYSNRVRAVRAF